jgi:hypothetical protein
VASSESNGPSRILAHCSFGVEFVKLRTTCILQEDELRAVSCISSANIHGNRVIASHGSRSSTSHVDIGEGEANGVSYRVIMSQGMMSHLFGSRA